MAYHVFEANHLEQVCSILGDTQNGLTGHEIGRCLTELGMADCYPGTTKRYRLFEALSTQQMTDGDGQCVVKFIETVMNPVRYVRAPDMFEKRQTQLNAVLAFSGLILDDTGHIGPRDPAVTLEDAQTRADRLRKSLTARGVHADVLQFCQAELLQDNYFHAVFEATKSVAEKLRSVSSLPGDGSQLVEAALGGAEPQFAINSLQSDTEWSEQAGFINLLKGMFGVFRNTTAHAPRIHWTIDEQDALDLLSLASYVHRRLDALQANDQHKRRPAH